TVTGYSEGTFYHAYSYFLSVEKKINDKHSLNLTVFGAPSQRGGSSPEVQEIFDLVGSNFAYDSQKILRAAEHADGSEAFQKLAVYGALDLYLDFINIFLAILRIFGRVRRS
ncbi:MAG: Bax inhibitor-1 family protein, partial [Treponema sp.]|nr:Bax inhibitor-1 family protein [Treponema sp.]